MDFCMATSTAERSVRELLMPTICLSMLLIYVPSIRLRRSLILLISSSYFLQEAKTSTTAAIRIQYTFFIIVCFYFYKGKYFLLKIFHFAYFKIAI